MPLAAPPPLLLHRYMPLTAEFIDGQAAAEAEAQQQPANGQA